MKGLQIKFMGGKGKYKLQIFGISYPKFSLLGFHD